MNYDIGSSECDSAFYLSSGMSIDVSKYPPAPKIMSGWHVGENEPRQILETNTWVRLIWNDCNLRWNATETGIKNMVVPFKNIWVPDITLYDNAQNELGGLPDFRPDVYPDGTVYYNFPSVIKSLCKVDVTYFPFDTQQCKMKFGSWSSHGFDVNVSERVPAGDPSMFVANGEWELIGLPSIRHEIMYACCPQPYPDVTFFIQIRRKPLFYLLNLIFPCTLISTVAFLGFLLPPDSGEKISLEITVLLSLAVFLLVVSETMPPDSETFPYIGVYFACAMLLVSMSCLMTVTVLNLHFKGNFGKKMPNWVRKVFLHCFGRILHVKVTEKDARTVHEHRNNADRFHETHENAGFNVHPEEFRTDLSNHENNINKILNDLNETNGKQVNLPPEFDYDTSNELVRILKQQLDCLNSIKAHIDEKRELEDTMEDWKKLAQVVDRIFMVLFFAFQCITTLFILLRISTTDIPMEIE
ncbi:neuronal acetylcholine receptor subunit alpha-9-like [Mercenaria mercenaria]|uniref:neuronal acetylcholine receptor subunit alpha-9-like n=1 Tax=Mercenaria mercenaria TaxID=6596 RepID=UPI00234F4E52|nr:neuronal acetylcholine receptor subunit alpha-9-like [Mercenaria mercenaria]